MRFQSMKCNHNSSWLTFFDILKETAFPLQRNCPWSGMQNECNVCFSVRIVRNFSLLISFTGKYFRGRPRPPMPTHRDGCGCKHAITSSTISQLVHLQCWSVWSGGKKQICPKRSHPCSEIAWRLCFICWSLSKQLNPVKQVWLRIAVKVGLTAMIFTICS